MLWYSLATSTQKTYSTATNSYTKYCAHFEKRPFPTQVGGLAAWIGHLGERRLKSKTINGYLAGFCSLRMDCTLDLGGGGAN